MAGVYDRLVALARLEARAGSGYVVSAAGPASRRARGRTSRRRSTSSPCCASSWTSITRCGPAMAAPRPPGWRVPSSAPSSTRGGRRAAGVEHGYGSSWGYLPLRERICLSMAERSIQCMPDQVLLTHGANHAMDLIMRDMLEPGDAVLVDDPGYYPLFGKLRLAKARVVGIRRTPDGPDLDDLAAKAAALRPKLFFTQSLAHNPTGGSLSLPAAHGLLQLAERHDFHIVEDDPFADHPGAVQPAPGRPRPAAARALRRHLLQDAVRVAAGRLRGGASDGRRPRSPTSSC